MKSFTFFMPTKILFNENSVENILPGELASNGCKHVLLVADKGIVACGIAERVQKAITSTGQIKVTIFDGVEVNPTEIGIDEGYRAATSANCDAIVGVGGGSSMDTAKAIAVLMANGGEILEYCSGAKVASKPVKNLFLVPTTAGTGSEITKIFVVVNSKTRFKAGMKNDLFAPTAAILDPTLLLNLPQHILSSTGIDSLSHAIEGYVNTNTNIMTDFYMEKSIELIGANLRQAYSKPQNLEAQTNMLLACAINACAFQQSGLGLVHAMGHALGGKFNIPHGVACGLCLPLVVDFNCIANPEKFIKIAKLLGETNFSGNIWEDCYLAGSAIRNLMIDIGVPTSLEEIGLSEKDIDVLVEDSMKAAGLLLINPRHATKDDIRKLFIDLL